MESDILHAWSDFFVAEVGASAALAGLLFVAVSINLARILEYPHLPTRAMEALVALVSVLVIATCGLIPGQSPRAFGIEMAATGLLAWGLLSFALLRTRGSGHEHLFRILMNQLSAAPFAVGGVILATGRIEGLYWVVPGTLLSILGSVYGAWILLVEIQR